MYMYIFLSHFPHFFGSQVQGVYEYCHYMQDKFDDNGWCVGEGERVREKEESEIVGG